MNRTFVFPLSALLSLVLLSSVSLARPDASSYSAMYASRSAAARSVQAAPLASAASTTLCGAQWCMGTSVRALDVCHHVAGDCARGTCEIVSGATGGAKDVLSAIASEVSSLSLRNLQNVFSSFWDLVSDLLHF